MRVKVKKTRGVTGNQHNYGLVSGSIWNYEDQPTNNTVGTTLSPVPREDANIEAERGETIVFPDSDGDVAHAKIGGKRHSEGGTPLNVPDGSFVFSDFRGLLIKNKEVLKDIFNISGTKSKTPAEIAKKYEINSYKETLKDPWADPMDKKTAQLMIENNMKKLGQLALIQEGMKGFPDGIPDIALPLMGSDIAQGQPIPQEQGMPMARYGGLPKAAAGNNPSDAIKAQLAEARKMYSAAAAGSSERKQALAAISSILKQYPNIDGANQQVAKPQISNRYSSSKEGRDNFKSDIQAEREKQQAIETQKAAKQLEIDKRFGRTGSSTLGVYQSAAGKKAGYTEASAKPFIVEETNSGKAKVPVDFIKKATEITSDAEKEKFLNRAQAEMERREPGIEFPTSLPENDPVKAAQVAQANKIYREAVLSGDPDAMRTASDLLNKMDISGLSTPIGMIGSGTRKVTEGLHNWLHNPFYLNQVLGLGVKEADLKGYNPYGFTWQEKIYDMSDVLDERAINLKSESQRNINASKIQARGKEAVNKLTTLQQKAQQIIANPSAYTSEQLSKAAELLYDLSSSNQHAFAPTRWFGKDPMYMAQKTAEYQPTTDANRFTNSGFLSPAAKDPLDLANEYYDVLMGPGKRDQPTQMDNSSSSSTANPYPEGNYFDSKTGNYLNGATDATAAVLKEQTKVNQVDKKLRDNNNIPYEEKIGNKYVQYIRTPSGKIAALFIPEPSTADVAEGETQQVKSDSTSTRNKGEVKTKDKNKVEESDDTYTTLDEALDLWNQASPQQPQQKFGGQQQIISYDPVKRFEMGGQLSQYKGGGGKHTQLIKETALKSTAEYDVIMPNKKLDYTFGTQSFDPTKNYYTAINKTTGKEEELDLNDFINRQTDVLKAYDGGIDKWKADVLSKDKATREKASGWFQENYNTWRKANGLPDYFITKSGKNPYGKDNKLGVYTWSAPGIKKKVKADVIPPPPANTPPPAATTPSQPGAIPPQNYEQGIAGTPWWHYDLVNYGSQLSNYFDVNPGELPTFMNYVPYVPDPTFLDPARAIAQQQGVVRGTQEAMMAGSDPTVARANMIAASAGAAPQIANIMAQYDERNAGIANQYESSRAQILNQAQLQNQQFEKQYRDELEVRRQQYENALREGRTNVAKSIMQGLKNASETSWVNATSDSYAVDPGTGQVYFKRGFDPLKGSFRSQTGSIADAYEELLNKGWSDEQARSILELQVKSKLPMNKSEAQYGGSMYNPMDLLWND